ncbi:TetR/AcrR family transcriptional regulator [Lapillicoccus sp.]|uniref:TetR/AcrR family transcriptional regulator n=1 Tax=Lapillicoccus sp. TaxID=1909287 RepID=UPI00398383EA
MVAVGQELARHAVLLDAAVRCLVAQPRASLAQIATAAGIGRTTLFKLFATRDQLEHAVAMRALSVCEAAINSASGHAEEGEQGGDGGLRALVTALIPIGPQLTFVWRSTSLDVDEEVVGAYHRMDAALLGALASARQAGVLRADRPEWWLGQTLYALVHVAWDSVQCGQLARLDAPDLVLDTLLGGVGTLAARTAR